MLEAGGLKRCSNWFGTVAAVIPDFNEAKNKTRMYRHSAQKLITAGLRTGAKNGQGPIPELKENGYLLSNKNHSTCT